MSPAKTPVKERDLLERDQRASSFKSNHRLTTPVHATHAKKRRARMAGDRDKLGAARLLDDEYDDEFSDTDDSSAFLVEPHYPEVPPLQQTSRLKIAIYLTALVIVVALFAMLIHSGWLGPMFLKMLTFVRKLGGWGPIVLLLLITILIPTCIPTTPLNIGAGFLFGWLGLPVITTAALCGSSISFWISRRLYGEAAERRLRDVKIYHTLNILLAEDKGRFSWKSLKVVLLTRASPLFPFPLINYACGLTRVGYSSYAAGTAIGMIPWHIIDIYIGTFLTNLQEIEEGHSTTYIIAVLIFTLILTVIVTVFARRLLRSMEATTRLEKARTEESLSCDDDILLKGREGDVELEFVV